MTRSLESFIILLSVMTPNVLCSMEQNSNETPLLPTEIIYEIIENENTLRETACLAHKWATLNKYYQSQLNSSDYYSWLIKHCGEKYNLSHFIVAAYLSDKATRIQKDKFCLYPEEDLENIITQEPIKPNKAFSSFYKRLTAFGEKLPYKTQNGKILFTCKTSKHTKLKRLHNDGTVDKSFKAYTTNYKDTLYPIVNPDNHDIYVYIHPLLGKEYIIALDSSENAVKKIVLESSFIPSCAQIKNNEFFTFNKASAYPQDYLSLKKFDIGNDFNELYDKKNFTDQINIINYSIINNKIISFEKVYKDPKHKAITLRDLDLVSIATCAMSNKCTEACFVPFENKHISDAILVTCIVEETYTTDANIDYCIKKYLIIKDKPQFIEITSKDPESITEEDFKETKVVDWRTKIADWFSK